MSGIPDEIVIEDQRQALKDLAARLAALELAAWDVHEAVTIALELPDEADIPLIQKSLDEMGELLPAHRPAHSASPLQVKCARCGVAGTSETFIVEEGDEWECPACWERCEAQERPTSTVKAGP